MLVSKSTSCSAKPGRTHSNEYVFVKFQMSSQTAPDKGFVEDDEDTGKSFLKGRCSSDGRVMNYGQQRCN
jgi:hypothetical protein